MKLFSWIAGTLSIGTHLFTMTSGKHVGTDEFGNKYYRQRGEPSSPIGFHRERRWVIFGEGDVEASRVPPEWHAWLHHSAKDLPESWAGEPRQWQRGHRPNLTGTDQAYRPPGHTLMGNRRDKATGDYEPWVPN